MKWSLSSSQRENNMDLQPCMVTLWRGEESITIPLVLDLDDSLEDQLYALFPDITDFKWYME
jgi:hypothetical protein